MRARHRHASLPELGEGALGNAILDQIAGLLGHEAL
jgi:hypothetical protein